MRHQVDDRLAVAFAERGRNMGIVASTDIGQFVLRAILDVHTREYAMAKRQHTRPQPVFAPRFALHQIAQLAQSIGQPGNRGLGQTSAGGKGLVGQIGLVPAKRRQKR